MGTLTGLIGSLADTIAINADNSMFVVIPVAAMGLVGGLRLSDWVYHLDPRSLEETGKDLGAAVTYALAEGIHVDPILLDQLLRWDSHPEFHRSGDESRRILSEKDRRVVFNSLVAFRAEYQPPLLEKKRHKRAEEALARHTTIEADLKREQGVLAKWGDDVYISKLVDVLDERAVADDSELSLNSFVVRKIINDSLAIYKFDEKSPKLRDLTPQQMLADIKQYVGQKYDVAVLEHQLTDVYVELERDHNIPAPVRTVDRYLRERQLTAAARLKRVKEYVESSDFDADFHGALTSVVAGLESTVTKSVKLWSADIENQSAWLDVQALLARVRQQITDSPEDRQHALLIMLGVEREEVTAAAPLLSHLPTLDDDGTWGPAATAKNLAGIPGGEQRWLSAAATLFDGFFNEPERGSKDHPDKIAELITDAERKLATANASLDRLNTFRHQIPSATETKE